MRLRLGRAAVVHVAGLQLAHHAVMQVAAALALALTAQKGISVCGCAPADLRLADHAHVAAMHVVSADCSWSQQGAVEACPAASPGHVVRAACSLSAPSQPLISSSMHFSAMDLSSLPLQCVGPAVCQSI